MKARARPWRGGGSGPATAGTGGQSGGGLRRTFRGAVCVVGLITAGGGFAPAGEPRLADAEALVERLFRDALPNSGLECECDLALLLVRSRRFAEAKARLRRLERQLARGVLLGPPAEDSTFRRRLAELEAEERERFETLGTAATMNRDERENWIELDAIRAGIPPAAEARLAAAGRDLARPVLDSLLAAVAPRASELGLIPDGPLWLVSWAAFAVTGEAGR